MHPEKRTVILHIGQGKTGSSSIQHALAGYDDGTTFHATFGHNGNHSLPMMTIFNTNFLKHHHWKRLGYSENEIRRERERFRAEFSAMLKRRDRNRIIISGEAMWDSEKVKLSIVEFLRQHGWEVRVIAYVREPTSWAAAKTSNRIRSGNPKKDVSLKLSQNFRRGLSALAEHLTPECLDVRVFDPARFEGGPVGDFCQAVGIDLLRVPGAATLSEAKAVHKNRDLSLSAMKLIHRFNRTGILSRGDASVYATRRRLVAIIEEKYAGMGTLDPSLCEGVEDRSDTDWLYETFGIDFRRKTPPIYSATDLEEVLMDLSDVDLCGLDELLAGYGIRHENFTTAEEKLHRLFYELLKGPARGERSATLFHYPVKNITKYLCYQLLRRLSNFSLLSPARRGKLALMATRLRARWIGVAP